MFQGVDRTHGLSTPGYSLFKKWCLSEVQIWLNIGNGPKIARLSDSINGLELGLQGK